VHVILRHAVGAGALLALLGSSCSASNKTPTTNGAAKGIPFSTTRFTTSIPRGWADDTGNQALAGRLGITDPLFMLIDAPPPDRVQPGVNDLRANIAVTVLSQPVPSGQLPQYLQSVRAAGATNLSSAQAFSLDEVPGVFITYDRVVSGTPATTQDMAVDQGGSTFDIQLNTSARAFATQLPALRQILDAWMWLSSD
jgi:hypothetical protein